MDNKVVYGLKNVHYAVLKNEDVSEYFTPIRLPGAAELSLSPIDSTTENSLYYVDDGKIYFNAFWEGYEGTLTLSNIPEHFYINCLNRTTPEKGILLESGFSTHPFALLFEFDGDQKKTRHVIYRCYALRPSLKGLSKSDSLDLNGQGIPIKAFEALDQKIIKASATQSSEFYDSWFDEVQLFTPDVTAMSQIFSGTKENIVWNNNNF